MGILFALSFGPQLKYKKSDKVQDEMLKNKVK